MGDLIVYFLFGPLALLMLFNAALVLVAVNAAPVMMARLRTLSGAHLGVETTTRTLLMDSAARSITLFLLGFVPVVALGGAVSYLSDAVRFDVMAFPVAGAAGLLFGVVRSCLLIFQE